VRKLLLSFYGDDFTGSTDALEQLALGGIRAALFVQVPSAAQLRRYSDLRAVGVAGMTRALGPGAMERELAPALKKLKALGARHVHYKVCSTFDSSPKIGSIGCVLELAAKIFHAPFVPVLAASPGLGRYCVFGNLFARFGIGSDGPIHRLDRHPSASRHPVTPMKEADLRRHLARQTRRRIALFDILQLALPERAARTALNKILEGKPDAVLFDALYPEQWVLIGKLIDAFATAQRPLFSIGSSGIETALAAHWSATGRGFSKGVFQSVARAKQVLVGSGSCSPVTERQIAWARKHDFGEVALNAAAFRREGEAPAEIARATAAAVKVLRSGRSVIVHTTRGGPDPRVSGALKHGSARILGAALGQVLRGALQEVKVRRVCIAGGDTSSFAARAMGIEAVEIMAPLTPGAPLCRAQSPGSVSDGLEIVFKGGQVGAENYFDIVRRGKI
jgi:3-oxoisoapionate kinase